MYALIRGWPSYFHKSVIISVNCHLIVWPPSHLWSSMAFFLKLHTRWYQSICPGVWLGGQLWDPQQSRQVKASAPPVTDLVFNHTDGGEINAEHVSNACHRLPRCRDILLKFGASASLGPVNWSYLLIFTPIYRFLINVWFFWWTFWDFIVHQPTIPKHHFYFCSCCS